MNTHYISRSGFNAIFDDCMRQGFIYYADGTAGKCTPKMIIRDFDTAEKNSCANDAEFKEGQCDKAWALFKIVDNARVMDNSGSIYIDAFGDEDGN